MIKTEKIFKNHLLEAMIFQNFKAEAWDHGKDAPRQPSCQGFKPQKWPLHLWS